jgi:hypothetical protein
MNMSLRFLAILLLASGFAVGQNTAPPVATRDVTSSASADERPKIVHPALTTAGSPPFYLRAKIFEIGDPTSHTEVEWLWLSPSKWRRTIKSDDFSQTLIVNGDKERDEHSDDYFPIGMERLITAMVDPRPLLNAWRPGDQLLTRANGKSHEDGLTCFTTNMCMKHPGGLTEIVGVAGYSITFSSYREFHDVRVARSITYTVGGGEGLRAEVTELGDYASTDDAAFRITEPTPLKDRISSATLAETHLRSLAAIAPEVIWPQVLDGSTTGTAQFYIGVAPNGDVREVLPIHTDNERSNDAARRQISKWKFKPLERNGTPVQIEGPLTFTLNTRAYGPKEPLTDAEVRELATNTVDPVFPANAPVGGSCSIRVAIDEEGSIVEMIAGDGTRGLAGPCMNAIKKWHFQPYLENGNPRPYRAEIHFAVPAQNTASAPR